MDASELQTFEQFPNLPTELRRKIWRMASPEPCLVIVIFDRRLCHHTVQRPLGRQLSINQESRSEELLWSQQGLVFARDAPHPNCLINLNVDTLFLKKPGSYDETASLDVVCLLSDAIYKELKFLAISALVWQNLSYKQVQQLLKLRNLEKIYIVVSIRASKLDFHTCTLVDAVLDVSRSSRETEVRRMITNDQGLLVNMSLAKDPGWKVPDLAYKIRLGKGQELLDMGDYYAEGLIEQDEWDDGYSDETSDRLD